MRRPLNNTAGNGFPKVDLPGAVRWQLSGGQGRLATDVLFSLIFIFALLPMLFIDPHCCSLISTGFQGCSLISIVLVLMLLEFSLCFGMN